MVNEPSEFELLKFHCSMLLSLNVKGSPHLQKRGFSHWIGIASLMGLRLLLKESIWFLREEMLSFEISTH